MPNALAFRLPEDGQILVCAGTFVALSKRAWTATDMSRLRSFEPQPWAGWTRLFLVWLGAVLALILAQAWLPAFQAFAAAQALIITGLMMAIWFILIAVARMNGGYAGRAIIAVALSFLLFGATPPAERLSGRLRLAVERADYEAALTQYRLTGQARCDCVLTGDVAAFRWDRLPAGWRGIAYDPAGRLSVGDRRLGGAVTDLVPITADWRLITVARPEYPERPLMRRGRP